MRCPRCRQSMKASMLGEIEGHGCEPCQAHAVRLGKLRAGGVAFERLMGLWRSAGDEATPGTCCPACDGAMVVVHTAEGVELDICRACKLLYFDRLELEAMVAEAGVSVDATSPAAPRSSPPVGLDWLLEKVHTAVRQEWKLLIGLGVVGLAFWVSMGGLDRARCAWACQRQGYVDSRYVAPIGHGRYGSRDPQPERCKCFTQEEFDEATGVPVGVEVPF